MFSSAIKVLPCDIGECFSSFFSTVVVAVFISIFILQLKNVFCNIILGSEIKFYLFYLLQDKISNLKEIIIKNLQNDNEKLMSKLIILLLLECQ